MNDVADQIEAKAPRKKNRPLRLMIAAIVLVLLAPLLILMISFAEFKVLGTRRFEDLFRVIGLHEMLLQFFRRILI